MIKKNDESGKEVKKVSSFKKFSEMSGPKPKDTNEDPSSPALPETEDDRPANPNLPYNKVKVEKPASTDYMMPNGVKTNPKKGGFTGPGSDTEE